MYYVLKPKQHLRVLRASVVKKSVVQKIPLKVSLERLLFEMYYVLNPKENLRVLRASVVKKGSVVKTHEH